MSTRKLLVATHNPGKVREYAQLLTDLPLSVTWLDDVGVADAVEETGTTYTENALLKAQRLCSLDRPVDLGRRQRAGGRRAGRASGRLFGALRRARSFGPPALRPMLLTALAGVPESQRTARFRCVVALATPDGRTWTTEGAVEGRILTAPRGANGFGYDPIFFVPGYAAAMAELPESSQEPDQPPRHCRCHARRLLADLLAGALTP
jgi:inosine/xanthosine triphosphate pyrophosphatase family protein